MTVRAERFTADGPAPRLVSEGAPGHFAFTADGKRLLFVQGANLVAAPVREGEPRVLGPASYFLPTPDGRFVIVPGTPWTRLSVSGADGKVTLARGEVANALSGNAVGNTRLAFITAEGPMAVATLDEGTSVRLPVDAPKDARCHAGAGYPRAFSADETWLLFQHGCEAVDLIRPDGTDWRRLGLVTAFFVGDVVVGNARAEGGSTGLPGPPLHVVPLKGGDRWTLPGVVLSPTIRPVPGRRAFLQADRDERQVLVDLDAKATRVLHEGDGRVTSFLETTPDGTRALYATMQDGSCAVHQVDLAKGKRQRLAAVDGAQQCFIKPAGPRRAVLYTWRASSREDGEALVATVDLDSGHVRQLGQALRGVGNFYTSDGAVAVTAGNRLYLATF